MNNSPLVSILLSIYNVDKYLTQCLDSVINQTYKNIEIICVDNGSTDNCASILRNYANLDKRVKVISLKKNIYLCGGRNCSIDNAKGEFVCFIDPDDWIENKYIEFMVNAALSKRDKNGELYKVIVNSNALNFKTNNDNVDIVHQYNDNIYEGDVSLEDINSGRLKDNYVPMWGRLFKRKFLLEHPDIRFIEGTNLDDIPFNLKVLVNVKNYYLIGKRKSDNITYWRRLNSSEGALTPIVLYKDNGMINALLNLYEYLKKYNLESKLKIPFTHIFKYVYPSHINKHGFYEAFKLLSYKLEPLVKTSNLYDDDDKTLIDLALNSNSYLEFNNVFRLIQRKKINLRLKLFDVFYFFKYKKDNLETKIYFFNILLLTGKKIDERTYKYFLFNIIPILKVKLSINYV